MFAAASRTEQAETLTGSISRAASDDGASR
jgi:hypothetical protein